MFCGCTAFSAGVLSSLSRADGALGLFSPKFPQPQASTRGSKCRKIHGAIQYAFFCGVADAFEHTGVLLEEGMPWCSAFCGALKAGTTAMVLPSSRSHACGIGCTNQNGGQA